jgi:hypothetical protein
MTTYNAYVKGTYRVTSADIDHCICTRMRRFNTANKDRLDARGPLARYLDAVAEAADTRSESDGG